jgi:uncharacterized protein
MNATGMRLVDGHCHVPSSRFVPVPFIEGTARNAAAVIEALGLRPNLNRLIDDLLLELQDHQADALVAAMDRAGIAHSLLLCPDFTWVFPEAGRTIEEMLRAHAEIAARHAGRFSWLAGVDPRWGKDGVDLFEKALRDWGAAGLKLYPPCGYEASAPMLDPYYELCASYGVPVLLHTGPTSPALAFSTAHPLTVDGAALRFPTVNFILAHAPVAHGDVCLYLARFRPNVYFDLSGWQTHDVSTREASLARLLPRALLHKAIFGTDWPVFSREASLEGAVAEFSRLELVRSWSPSHAALVLGMNIERLLRQRRGSAVSSDRLAARREGPGLVTEEHSSCRTPQS